MTRRLLPIALLLSVAAFGSAPTSARSSSDQLVVHEWGTFTSIAGADGRAESWLPLDAPQDLPCFVDRYRFNIKGSVPGTIRMETPVLYFYSPVSTQVSVNVRFRQGAITEWYPRATVTPGAFSMADFARLHAGTLDSALTWPEVRVTPGARPDFPTESAASHYYLARATDATPIVAAGQPEKFLFYRGIGSFQPPLTATLSTAGSVAIAATGPAPLGDVILFENRGGTMAYEVRHVASGRVTLSSPKLEGETVPPTFELEQLLVAHGLYPKEAKAMVDTWRDSWFEEGTRLFYIAPTRAIDDILPLDIRPAPSSVVRVFVGRIELFTQTTLDDVSAALNSGDRTTLLKYGRFLRPIADRLAASRSDAERARMQAVLQPLYSAAWAAAAPCR